jgi:hypothetical protein
MRRAAIALVLLTSVGAQAQQAGADVERAQGLFNVGAQAYAQGEFKGAIDAFEEAYRASPRPGILFSIAQAHRKQFYATHDASNLRAAVEHYRSYVGKVSSGKYRVTAVEALAELEAVATKIGATTAAVESTATTEKRTTRVMVSAAVDGARVALDDGPFKPTPLIAAVTPGKHSVRVSADGYFDEQHPLVAVEGELVALDIPLRERPAGLVVHAESGADVLVDRRPVGRTPLTGAIELSAGTHFVAVTRNGRRPYGEEIKVARGETRTLDVELGGTGQRVVSYVLLTAAAVGVAAGGVFVGLAFYEQGQAESTRVASGARNISQSELDGYAAALNARDQLKLAAYGAFGGAVALAIGAGALFLFDTPHAPLGPSRLEEGTPQRKPKEGSPLEVSALPLVGPGFMGASLVGRF